MSDNVIDSYIYDTGIVVKVVYEPIANVVEIYIIKGSYINFFNDFEKVSNSSFQIS